jgi:ferrochelatase
LFYNHPGFIEAMADRVWTALESLPEPRRRAAPLIYTAHSIPLAMAKGCDYVAQVRETCGLVSERVGRADWSLAYQSRSGPPQQPWLEPDVGDMILELHRKSPLEDVAVVPIGFLNEHIEVVYDLDVEVAGLCELLGVNLVRAAVVGTHPRFVTMIREMIQERFDPQAPRPALGTRGPWPNLCPAGCCRQPEAAG